MTTFDLLHAIEECVAELDAAEQKHFGAIAATKGTRAESIARAKYDGMLESRHAVNALIKTFRAAIDEKMASTQAKGP